MNQHAEKSLHELVQHSKVGAIKKRLQENEKSILEEDQYGKTPLEYVKTERVLKMILRLNTLILGLVKDLIRDSEAIWDMLSGIYPRTKGALPETLCRFVDILGTTGDIVVSTSTVIL